MRVRLKEESKTTQKNLTHKKWFESKSKAPKDEHRDCLTRSWSRVREEDDEMNLIFIQFQV